MKILTQRRYRVDLSKLELLAAIKATQSENLLIQAIPTGASGATLEMAPNQGLSIMWTQEEHVGE
jgi:hypothetical protein